MLPGNEIMIGRLRIWSEVTSIRVEIDRVDLSCCGIGAIARRYQLAQGERVRKSPKLYRVVQAKFRNMNKVQSLFLNSHLLQPI